MLTATMTVLTLMAILSAVIAVAASIRSSRLSDEVMRILSALSSERSKIALHDTAIQDLHGRFQQLQGRFYAERKRRTEESEEVDQPSAADVKARLRKQLGLVPGRKPNG